MARKEMSGPMLELERFISGIAFNAINPDTRVPPEFAAKYFADLCICHSIVSQPNDLPSPESVASVVSAALTSWNRTAREAPLSNPAVLLLVTDALSAWKSNRPDTRLSADSIRALLVDRDIVLKNALLLDLVNTRLPLDEKKIHEMLEPLCRIPRMSTFALAAMIHHAVSEMDESHAFLQIGVWHGFMLLAGMMEHPEKLCIGVDNFSEFAETSPLRLSVKRPFYERFHRAKSPNHRFYEMDYRDYFQKIHREPIGVYVYDGEHSYQNQRGALEAAEPFLREGSVIFVEDTNWEEPRQATLDFISRNRGAYRILLDQRTGGASFATFSNGVMVFRREG